MSAAIAELPCLFCSETKFISIEELVEHTKSEHGVSLSELEAVSLPGPFLAHLQDKIDDIQVENIIDFSSTRVTSLLEVELARLRDIALADHESEMQTELGPVKCILCNDMLSGTKEDLLSHIFTSHGFSVGLPTNLVHITHMLEAIRATLKANTCIYCHGQFKAYQQLRSHMRKRRHLRLDPRDARFDAFYMTNHLAVTKPTGATAPNSDSDSSSEYQEPTMAPEHVKCLYCPADLPSARDLDKHCIEAHNVDLQEWRGGWRSAGLTMYERISLINHIRRTGCTEMPSKEAFAGEGMQLVPVVAGDPLLCEPEWVGDDGEDSDE